MLRRAPSFVGLWTLGVSAAVVGVLSSCSADNGSRSARFVETTTYYSPDGAPQKQRITGSFDWAANVGRALAQGFPQPERTIQIGDQCYSRGGSGSWKNTIAEDVDGLCNASLFSSPYDQFLHLSQVASSWRAVGAERVRGVDVTHHRGRLQGSIDLWVDEEKVVRRFRQANGDTRDRFVTVREYYDFGVDVYVSAPAPFAGGGG